VTRSRHDAAGPQPHKLDDPAAYGPCSERGSGERWPRVDMAVLSALEALLAAAGRPAIIE